MHFLGRFPNNCKKIARNLERCVKNARKIFFGIVAWNTNRKKK